jgi:hypothetical protein
VESKSWQSQWEYLDSFGAMVFEAKKKLIQEGKTITAALFKDIITGQGGQSKQILEYFKEHNDRMFSLISKDYASGTWDRFDRAYWHTPEFIRLKYQKEDFSIEFLDYDFISSFYHWFRTEKDYSVNTTLKYIQNFKKIILTLIKKKILPGDPFIDFSVKNRYSKDNQ